MSEGGKKGYLSMRAATYIFKTQEKGGEYE